MPHRRGDSRRNGEPLPRAGVTSPSMIRSFPSKVRPFSSFLLFAIVALSPLGPAKAESLIDRPGDHNQYKFELEPQLVIHAGTPGWGRYYCHDPNYPPPPPGTPCDYY